MFNNLGVLQKERGKNILSDIHVSMVLMTTCYNNLHLHLHLHLHLVI